MRACLGKDEVDDNCPGNVRRDYVHEAIIKLRAINPVWSNVEIDFQAHRDLPERGTPDTIVVRDGVDQEMIALAKSEGVGYMRTDDDNDENGDEEEERVREYTDLVEPDTLPVVQDLSTQRTLHNAFVLVEPLLQRLTVA